MSLTFPDDVTRADVSLTNKANVYVDAAGGGNIAINARNLDILGGSTFIADTRQGLGSVSTQAGDITLAFGTACPESRMFSIIIIK